MPIQRKQKEDAIC